MKKCLYFIFGTFIVFGICLFAYKKHFNGFNSIQKDVIAYYVDNANGSYNKQNTVPTGDYIINQELSRCLAGGTISDYDSSHGTIKYTLASADRCVVYFDNPMVMPGYLTYEIYNAVAHTELGGMFRYTSASASATVNNYVCLAGNTTICNDEFQNENYLYRIIGITKNDPVGNPDGLIKIIKDTQTAPIDDAYLEEYNYDADVDKKWGENDLYKRLNGQTSNGAPIFKNTIAYGYLNNLETKGIIVPANWKIKDINAQATDEYLPSFNALAQYNAENPGNNEADKLISTESNKHYYGLAYASDFLYSNNENNTDFPNANVRNETNNLKGWMFNFSSSSDYDNEWTMARYEIYDAWVVYGAGEITHTTIDVPAAVRPVFYLSNSTKILEDGNGSKNTPYIIKIN